MFQGALVTLISLALYFSSLLGGEMPPARRSALPPASQVAESDADSSLGVVTGNVVVVYDAIGSRKSIAELRRGDYVRDTQTRRQLVPESVCHRAKWGLCYRVYGYAGEPAVSRTTNALHRFGLLCLRQSFAVPSVAARQ